MNVLKTTLAIVALLLFCNSASAVGGWRYADGKVTAEGFSTPSVSFTVVCERHGNFPVVKVILDTPPLGAHVAHARVWPAVIQVGAAQKKINVSTSNGLLVGGESLDVARLLSTKGELTVYFDAVFSEEDGRYVAGVSEFSRDYYVPVQFPSRDRREGVSRVLRQCGRG